MPDANHVTIKTPTATPKYRCVTINVRHRIFAMLAIIGRRRHQRGRIDRGRLLRSNDDLRHDASRENLLDAGVAMGDALLMGVEQHLLEGGAVRLDAERK